MRSRSSSETKVSQELFVRFVPLNCHGTGRNADAFLKRIGGLLQSVRMFGIAAASSTTATLRRQRQLGRELRRLYRPVEKEPVPEDMLEQLKQIDRASAEETSPQPPRKHRSH
jgi:hypothetical protein